MPQLSNPIRVCLLAVLAAVTIVFEPVAWCDERPQPESATHYKDHVHPVLVKYCGECHTPKSKDSAEHDEAVVFLGDLTAAAVSANRGIWASVAEQLRNRTMPPSDESQPTEGERREVSQWIETHLIRTACDQGEFAGNPVARRINRDQYTFAIEDLTGLEFDFVETFPADGSGGEGFDNNGETLFLPPLLLERYFEVAEDVVDRLVVTKPFDETYRSVVRNDAVHFAKTHQTKNEKRGELLPGQSATLTTTVPNEADFKFTVKATHDGTDRANLVLSVDGIVAKTLPISRNKNAPPKWTIIRFSRGVHQISLRLPKHSGATMEIQTLRLEEQLGERSELRLRQAATDRLFGSDDQQTGDDRDSAETVVRDFARRAWRRPVRDSEIRQLMTLYDRGIQRGESARQATKLPLKAILVSPNFLFLVEKSPSQGIKRVSDLELASRLSFFLWHSLPDEELVSLAAQGKLHRPSVLRHQVKRMLADPRSFRFADAFAGQWLGTVAVGRTVIPDTNHFKATGYTTELVTDLRRQVAETMAHHIRQNRPVTDWLDCEYALVNRRLAKHYGLEDVPKSDDRFDVIQLTDSPRTGVLGLGAVHMLTSYSRRTSPVLRGGWVLETLIGVHLPAPPPDAGNLPGGEKEDKKKTVRDRLLKHRENATCAACHDLIDPIGFAMENFDVLGRWREKEGKLQIDAKGKLPSGETFTGPIELRNVLANRKDEFLHQICQRMLGYALGRSLQDADQCTVTKLVDRLQQNDAKLHELILGIVESAPFQNRQAN